MPPGAFVCSVLQASSRETGGGSQSLLSGINQLNGNENGNKTEEAMIEIVLLTVLVLDCSMKLVRHFKMLA